MCGLSGRRIRGLGGHPHKLLINWPVRGVGPDEDVSGVPPGLGTSPRTATLRRARRFGVRDLSIGREWWKMPGSPVAMSKVRSGAFKESPVPSFQRGRSR